MMKKRGSGSRYARQVAASPRAWVFAAWAVVGLGLTVAALTPFTIGIVVFPATAVVLLVLLLWPGGRNISAIGLLSGPGLVFLYVGYLNRGGPGDVCGVTGTEHHCVTEWNPWPEVAVGVVLLATGVGLFMWFRRHGPGEK